jgi:hypothetical protein
MSIFCRNWSTLRKPAPVPFCLPQILYELIWNLPRALTRKSATSSLSFGTNVAGFQLLDGPLIDAGAQYCRTRELIFSLQSREWKKLVSVYRTIWRHIPEDRKRLARMRSRLLWFRICVKPLTLDVLNVHVCITTELIVGLEVLTAVVMKSATFCNITPCSPLKVNRRFVIIYRLHLQCRISRARYQGESRW